MVALKILTVLKRNILTLILSGYFCTIYSAEEDNTYLGSRESDPASIVENVSMIHGDYSDYEVDLIVPGPDPLTLSRFYSSRDSLLAKGTFGGWRFNPHSFLYVEKDVQPRTYTTSEGKFDYVRILIGTNEGSVLTFAGWQNTTNPDIRSLFKLDIDSLTGLANTARGKISAWTNLRNNQLYFEVKDHHFELYLSSGGKRFYIPSPSTPNLYLLKVETLPSGNQIFYEYKGDAVCEIKMTNASAEKVFSWIKIQYGPTIHIQTSDGKSVDYHFNPNPLLLSEVVLSHKPPLKYKYCIVDDHPLLIKKEWPEGRYVKIDYYPNGKNKNKVASINTPNNVGQTTSTRFSYAREEDDSGFTEANGPLTRKTIYRFDDQFQLTAIEHYLNGALYRTQKKIWGIKKNAGNLIGTSIEDGQGCTYYYKSFAYDEKNNIVEEREFGNLTGSHPEPLILDEEGIPESNQESHAKTYTYRTAKDSDVIIQKDQKGNLVKSHYKQGTPILINKFIIDKNGVNKRWFYTYNDDGVLVQVVVDDGDEEKFECGENFHERHITNIIPKQEPPNVGAPEVIEEKCVDAKNAKEILLKKEVNGFDSLGNIETIAIFDAEGEHRYTKTLVYEQGMLKSETNAIGDKTNFAYDTNQNLTSITYSNSSISWEYRYDLRNRLKYTGEKDNNGNCFETTYAYDDAGKISSELDCYGNKTAYVCDDLSRIISKIYPPIQTDDHRSIQREYTYTYDLFDNVICITDPNKETIQKSYTVHGAPTQILYPDGTKELFKYDPEGSLHRHLGRDGIVKVFEYDYQGRPTHIEHYVRGSKGKNEGFKREYFNYDAFHLISHEDEEGYITQYTYDGAGRLATRHKDDQKIEFSYDSLGRTHGIKKWKSAKTFTLDIQEYDLLDRIIEERTETNQGNILSKSRRVYSEAGYLQEVIGYPQNQESVLFKYNYDEFGRLSEIGNPYGNTIQIGYKDDFIDEWGQKVSKSTKTDPFGIQTDEILDPAGYLAKITKKNNKGKLLAESAFYYDLIGNVNLEKNGVIFNGESLRDYNIRKLYLGGILQSATLATETIEEKTTRWEYDGYGNLVTEHRSGITPITYKYNNQAQISSISYKEENKLSFDHKRNLKKIELGESLSIAHKIDGNNQLTSETVKDEFGSYQVKISYDGEGCIETLEIPDGSLIKYSYEGPFVKSISRQSKEKNELYKHRIISRDLMGHILEEVLIGHGGTRKLTWDQAGRKTGIFTDFFSDHTEYDLLNNMKNRIITLDGRTRTCDYGYDDLNQLISEEGHTYIYDSLGNRLKKDNSLYKINCLNQIIDTEEEAFTFDSAGNLETKMIGGKIWNFQTDPLGHLISIQDPNLTNMTFTYDLSGKRLSKKIDCKGKKTKISRYFYLGQTELGCLDEKGKIFELKVPNNPNNPEASPCIAIEIKGETYAPLYDLQGNIACLIDPERREVQESYTYSAFGEEKIINQRGKPILNSALENPWRYNGKRIDSETGLVYFGKRYYDPKIGRWLSPDPIGNIDGPNLYWFCRNNPLIFNDYFGLASEKKEDEFTNYFFGEYEPHCHCEHHRDCKRGGDIGDSIGGITSGITDFGIRAIEFYLQTPIALSLVPGLKSGYEDMVLSPLNHFHKMVDEGLEYIFDFDSLGERPLRYKNATKIGLFALDIFRGSVKDIRKGLLFFKNSQADLDINTLFKAGQVMDRGGLTRAGRALEKHGGRSGSVFPKPIGNVAEKNIQGQLQLEFILNHPDSIVRKQNLPRYGDIIDVTIPGKQGARFSGNGEFIGFLEP